jgi:hypothetical protein
MLHGHLEQTYNLQGANTYLGVIITAKALEGVTQQTLSLPPMPRGAYQTIVEGPAQRLKDTDRLLVIEPALVQALLADIEEGGGWTCPRLVKSHSLALLRVRTLWGFITKSRIAADRT